MTGMIVMFRPDILRIKHQNVTEVFTGRGKNPQHLRLVTGFLNWLVGVSVRIKYKFVILN